MPSRDGAESVACVQAAQTGLAFLRCLALVLVVAQVVAALVQRTQQLAELAAAPTARAEATGPVGGLQVVLEDAEQRPQARAASLPDGKA